MHVSTEHPRGIAAALWIRGAVFTVVAPIGLGVAVPMLFEREARPLSLPGMAVWPVIGAGAIFYASCPLRFLRAGGTPTMFFTRRFGSVIGHEPDVLVAGGLYRVTRNPMYVGVVLTVFGQALLYASAAGAIHGLLLWTFFHLTVVFGEEPRLRLLPRRPALAVVKQTGDERLGTGNWSLAFGNWSLT